MRVIAGTAKRLHLETPKGLETRPTTDRLKETLFNMLQPYIADGNFLDLFSGSGAIGIEALSRGADFAAFIENGKDALACIQSNLKITKLESRAQVLAMEVLQGLQTLENQNQFFHLVFMDPPYQCEYEKKVLEYLEHSKLINHETLIVFEASLDTDISDIEKMNYTIEKVKKYKTNMHVFVYRNI